MRSWMLKMVLLVLGCGLLLTGAKKLREVHVTRDVESHGVDPYDGARIYQQRMQETERILNDKSELTVSWNR